MKKVEKTAQGDKVTDYLVDDTFAYAQVVEEKTTLAGHTDTARYVWGDGLIAQVQGGQTRYVHADGLGSVKALTDTAGTLTDSYGYDAFGNGLERTGGNAQPYRFAGEYFDPEVGMQYHRARWYDPAIGRFSAMDPFSGNPSRPATLHKYAYANNDPVGEIDPSGEFGMASVGSALSISLNIASYASSIYDLLLAPNTDADDIDGRFTVWDALLATVIKSVAGAVSTTGGTSAPAPVAIPQGPTRLHHTIPEYMCGAKDQEQVILPFKDHSQLHTQLYNFAIGVKVASVAYNLLFRWKKKPESL